MAVNHMIFHGANGLMIQKLKLHQSIQLRKIAVGVFSLWIISNSAAACELATTVKDATVDDIRTFFKSQNKEVITFVGYSGAEYEDKMARFTRTNDLRWRCR